MKGPGRAVLLLIALAMLVMLVPSARSADVPPKDVIERIGERVIATLKNTQMSFDEKKSELRSEIERHFELDGMAQTVVGRALARTVAERNRRNSTNYSPTSSRIPIWAGFRPTPRSRSKLSTRTLVKQAALD